MTLLSTSSPTHHILEVSNLACQRGFNMLFEGLTFSVDSGVVMQITGANGSGKTSLLRILCGLSMSENGDVLFDGRSIDQDPATYRSQLSYLGHKNALKADLTPMENLLASASLMGGVDTNTIDSAKELLHHFGIGRKQNRPSRLLSAGQKQRSALVRVLMSNVPLWILDEPATALDPDGIAMLIHYIEQHLDRGGLVVFTSHQPFQFRAGLQQSISLDSMMDD